MRVLRRMRQQWRDVREQTRDVRDVWRVERDIDAAAAGRGPLIVGPWLSEVGYEVLYWIPFLRWFQRAYRIPRERVVAVSRGGVAGWYADVAARYVDVFACVDPGAVVERLQGSPGSSGSSKQLVLDEFDARIVDAVSEREKLSNPAVVHPSLMYRLFRSFWSGRASAGFIDRYTRFSRVEPDAPPLAGLPAEYIAVKFYTARSLPDTSETRSALASLVASLAERLPVVVLDTGLRLDDHDDFAFDRGARVISLREQIQPHDNLAVQTRAIAGARAFVGTCGSLAWLAPLLGVDTIPVFSDSKLLHAHLQVAWRAYHRVPGAGAFSPCDIGGWTRLGVGLGSAGAALASHGARVGTGVGADNPPR